MLTFEKYARASEKAVNEQDTDELMSLLAEDFRWVSFTQKAGGVDSAGMREFCLGGQVEGLKYISTIHDSDKIISGWSDITRNGEASKVLNILKIRDGRVYEYHHLRAPK